MSDYVFPASDFDRPKKLMQLLGSFWTNVFGQDKLVEDLAHGVAQLEAQTHISLLELAAAVSRFETPVFHRENWHLLTLNESDMNAGEASFLKYGDAAVYSPTTPNRYGVPQLQRFYGFDLETGLVDIPVLFNRITDPSLTLTRGIDYLMEDQAILFRENPFNNDLIPKRDVYSNGEVVDRQIGLWIFRGKFDLDTVFEQWGYVLQLRFESSQNYLDMLNAVFDALVEGTVARHVQKAFEAIVDVKLVVGDEEVVEEIIDEGDRQLVITDKHVYSYSSAATVLVAEGDTVHKGDPLTDVLRFYEFNRGQCPTFDEVRSLSQGRGFLAAGYFHELVFENEDKPLIVTTDQDGFTRVAWDLGGFPGDVEKFFDDLHANGKAAGQTMAHLLDQRTNKVGEPSAAALPATINPLQFLCENVFRDNAFLVCIKGTGAGPNALGLHAAKALRKIIPPQTVMIVCVELEVSDDPIIMEEAGTDTAPGVEEEMSVYLGLSLSDTISPNDMTEYVRAYQISGRCY